MRKKAFKAESKRLLELMINSIYTHKEIFLRELISNASDAIDKLYYRSLKDGLSGLSRDSFEINLSFSFDERTITLEDNGIGMTEEELESNLGTIAQSGSFKFKKDADVEQSDDVDVIGQFGVGFYSAFMIADEITVVTKAYGSEQAYRWVSSGVDGYTIEPCEKDGNGTIITLKVKPSSEDEDYDRFLEQYELQSLVRKYSDYIRYPIRMEVKKSRPKEGSEDEYEDYYETDTLNSMVPLWKKSKSEVTDEEYNRFYKDKFFDFRDPAKIIHINTEGTATFSALLFVPSETPYDYYTREYQKGLHLYASGVLITDCCKELLPDCFSFVKGLVDSQDLSLNISREMLQHDRQLKLIANTLEKKIKGELKSMLTDSREKYVEFFKHFGLQLKYGIYSSYGQKKELLGDLLLYRSSGDSDDKAMTTLDEYCERMREEQKYIYYAKGDSVERLARLPQSEKLLDKGYEILYLTDDIDEFVLRALMSWKDKEFRSVSGGDLGLEDEDDKAATEKQEESKDMLEYLCSVLDGKVKKVIASSKLKTYPVCLSTEGEISIEMERIINAAPGDQKLHAERVLELNAEHPLFEKLNRLFAEDDKGRLKEYADLLYGQALLIEGLPLEDPVAFSAAMSSLMVD